jgi:hypothetical protein
MRTRSLVVVILLGIGAFARAGMTEEEDKVVAGYPLTMEKVEKALRASAALNKSMKTNPALVRELDAAAREPTLAEQILHFDSNPKIVTLLKTFEITPRDFCLTLKAVVMARMASLMPPKLPHPAASGEHIKFYRDHQEEIERLEEDVVASAPSPN